MFLQYREPESDARAILQPLSPPDVDRHAEDGAIAVPGAGRVARYFAET